MAEDGFQAQARALTDQNFERQRRDLAGRVAGLVRGRKHHLGQQEALRARFETLRLDKHRQLEQLQGRQDAARLRAQERHAKDGKDMQQRHGQARHELAEWQAATREATERSQARALAERSLKQEFERNREQERGRER